VIARAARAHAVATVATAATVLPLALAPIACIDDSHPLGPSGSVRIRVAVAGALFAADVLDAEGNAVGPRQQPSSTRVELFMSEDSEPAYGAFVDVRVEPEEALALVADGPECERTDGAFRCTGSEEGYAAFAAVSGGDWSGEARVVVSWAGANGSNDSAAIVVLPAGLPTNATNFALVVEGQTGNTLTDRVVPTFEILECSVGPQNDEPTPKWRPGKVRHRTAYVRATAPASDPASVENAPVTVEALNSEGALSLSADCPDPAPAAPDDPFVRQSKLRVLLDAKGQSPPFYLCFSDHGGTIPFTFSSGQLSLAKLEAGQPLDRSEIVVETEPRLLRVVTKNPVVAVGEQAEFEITAYNSDLVKIAMTVFAQPNDPFVLQLAEGSSATLVTTPAADPQGGEMVTQPEAVVRVIAEDVGATELSVTPNLLDSPVCESAPVTVVPPEPPPS
jgi:hypothetical protein